MILVAKVWPDAFDSAVTITFFAFVVTATAAGYFFLVADYRAYLRRLRGVLVVAINYFTELPAWARETTPRCVAFFGLELPCDETDLLHAYRSIVKTLHPDRGGDRRRFHRLQSHFEEAVEFLREREARAQGGPIPED